MMTVTNPAKLAAALQNYADAISQHGVGSSQAQAVRAAHEDDAEFVEYADAFDRLQANLRARADTPQPTPADAVAG